MSQENGFLSRWSRLKREGDAAPVIVEVAPALPQAELPPDELEAKIATLPDLASFNAETDLKPFLQTWVPEALKKAAMRKMWSLDPALTTHECLPLDYAYDYNNPVGVIGFGALPQDFNAAKLMEEIFKPQQAIAKHIESESLEAKQEEVAALEEPQEEPLELEQTLPLSQTKRHGGALPA